MVLCVVVRLGGTTTSELVVITGTTLVITVVELLTLVHSLVPVVIFDVIELVNVDMLVALELLVVANSFVSVILSIVV